ncbi:MAG: UDP-3-O-(3-hydroxymyristoyl)glucosamine N-acyltransferase [Pseudomonadota bacterium]
MEYSVAEIAEALGGVAVGETGLHVDHAGEPGSTGATGLALALKPEYAEALTSDATRVALLWEDADWRGLGLSAAVLVSRPRAAMADLSALFDPGHDRWTGIHETAVIDPTASLGAGTTVGPFTVIGAGARVGAGSQIGAHCVIGSETDLGDGAILHPRVTLQPRIRIGARFIAHPGAVVGADGFSFVTPETLKLEEARSTLGTAERKGDGTDSRWRRIASLGTVEIGDDVEIGANSSVDRGTVRATRVGRGTKIDNIVQVGHNAVIGEDVLICSMSGVAGSATVGNRVVLGAKAGVNDNITIGDDVVVAGASRVFTNVPAGRMVMGDPAVKMETNLEIYKALRRLPRLLRDFRALQKSVSNGAKSD